VAVWGRPSKCICVGGGPIILFAVIDDIIFSLKITIIISDKQFEIQIIGSHSKQFVVES